MDFFHNLGHFFFMAPISFSVLFSFWYDTSSFKETFSISIGIKTTELNKSSIYEHVGI